MADKPKNGSFKAKIMDYGLSANKEGLPVAVVMFKYKDDDNDTHDVTWFGHFKGGAAEWTCKSLVTLGFKSDDPSILANGPSSNQLDMEKEVDIKCGWERYNDKDTFKVQFINESGMSRFQNKMEKPEASLRFQGMDLGVHFAEARDKTRQTQNAANIKNSAPPGIDTNENIPF